MRRALLLLYRFALGKILMRGPLKIFISGAEAGSFSSYRW